ncbi:flagellar hook-basal body complex protein FliE [Paenibacillus nasutitermitis]|uniref:Flagellar hook-basal body complex protein FliE n=1 Tax=Paenibacillus nasutitermitis TaxID=1652958 RepID=A0A917DTV3_9BACL|nr:flagellar hook-basal body complex protein FliE [Paenibacillus nasutitermitis]GGD68410.1 flagellar hook-basal body complex protein FliE [Paenibacillus nasutitermitis]
MINQTTLSQVLPTRSANANAVSEKSTPAEMTQNFGDFLQKALDSVSAQESNVSALTDQFMVGKVDVSQVMIAASQAEISLQLTTQIRNKVIDAYQEIMRMQV